MFRMLDMSEFGAQVRKIREDLNLTRKIVEELTGITKETLRKIEKGDVVPQFTTLQLLSVEYKIDLIEIFNQYKNSNLILNTHNLIDEILISHSNMTDSLSQFEISTENTAMCNLIDPVELKQFNNLIQFLPISYFPEKEKKTEAITGLLTSFNLHHEAYDFENFENYSYSYLELRTLHVIGALYADLKEYSLSNRIFNYLMLNINIDKYSSSPTKKLYIKLLCNIAYNYHSLDQHESIIKVVNEGIDFCNQFDSSYLLEMLLYRKAVSQYFLNDPKHKKTFKQVRSILEIKNYDEKIKIYAKVTKEKYNIDF
ncbi:MAG: helix-turn-helix transcriptional regulator [Clostridiales bacterium]|nr:helix-turn-helix transcriptional regulator [Clostridiales bacterium]